VHGFQPVQFPNWLPAYHKLSSRNAISKYIYGDQKLQKRKRMKVIGENMLRGIPGQKEGDERREFDG
jgi:hypothetical protein